LFSFFGNLVLASKEVKRSSLKTKKRERKRKEKVQLTGFYARSSLTRWNVKLKIAEL
jgi:hypothetical protein